VRLWRRRLQRGDPGPVPTVEEAHAELGPDAERMPHDPDQRLVIGAPDEVRDRLIDLATRYGGVEELVVLTICHDPAARARSYELLAGAFELRQPDQPASPPAPAA
jgi:alkanesulfonate monooxygenase SsuD/methylene tetrahydromethanopterin reductase-like flavin-dependent oxidoreductase (luciferase family)